jgi:hypothetical protein
VLFSFTGLAFAADDLVISGLNWSILFMMAIPYAVGGSIAAWIVSSHERVAGKENRTRNVG